MARLNEILVGRFNRSLQKLFGIKGEPPVATLAPEIMPVTVVQQGNETRYLDGWNRFAFAFLNLNVVGQSLGAQIRNPVGSNVIAVVEKFEIGVSSAAEMDVGLRTDNLDMTTLGTSFSLDARQTAKSSIIPSFQLTSPTTPAIIWRRNPPTVDTIREMITQADQQIVLAPGHGLYGTEATANVGLTVIIWWRERFLEEGERL